MLNLTKNVFQIHTEERIHEMFVDIFMNFILDGLCLSAKCSLSFLIILPAHSKLFSCSSTVGKQLLTNTGDRIMFAPSFVCLHLFCPSIHFIFIYMYSHIGCIWHLFKPFNTSCKSRAPTNTNNSCKPYPIVWSFIVVDLPYTAGEKCCPSIKAGGVIDNDAIDVNLVVSLRFQYTN